VFEVDVFPELLSMALSALRECPIVDVILLVAEHALLTHPPKASPVLVAFGALQAEVNPRERKSFMEVLSILPPFLGVALCTVGSQRSFMRILVTGVTGLCGHFWHLVPRHQTVGLESKAVPRGEMTLGALEPSVLTEQGITRRGMVKGFPLRKVRHSVTTRTGLLIESCMELVLVNVFMAGLTVLSV
jgi:hypothetical protein